MPEWVFFLVGQAFTAGAVYGAIKGDIKALVQAAENAKESADDAHKRIDNMFLNRGKFNG